MPSKKADAPTVEVREDPKLSQSRNLAEIRLGPILRHGMIAEGLAKSRLQFEGAESSQLDVVDVVRETAEAVAGGNLEYLSRSLTSQAFTLDATITELMHRAWANAGQYPDAFQRYMGLALKAQSSCRTTLEALAKLHQPREQVVRHVHVYEGGQAVVAEEFHHHPRGLENAGIADQCHAPDHTSQRSTALSSPNPIGQTMPGPEAAREGPVPNARRTCRRS